MTPTITRTHIPGQLIIATPAVLDARGAFLESWDASAFRAVGLDLSHVDQEFETVSEPNVLRGLHYQDDSAPIAKLVRCISGSIFDVVVDLRPDSPAFGCYCWLHGFGGWIYVPIGCAHGFYVLSQTPALVQYKQFGRRVVSAEGAIQWNDSDIGIVWPPECVTPILSDRDATAPSFAEYRTKEQQCAPVS